MRGAQAVNAEVQARTWPLTVIGMLGLMMVFALVVNAAVAVSRSGDASLQGVLRGNASIVDQVNNTDLTPRPATLERVWSERSLFGETFMGRLTDGETVVLSRYSGEQPGDRICTGVKHGSAVQVPCGGVQ